MLAVRKAIYLCSVLPMIFALRLDQTKEQIPQDLYLVHIAKSAGTSALYDIPEHTNAHFFEGEVCWDNEHIDGKRRVTFMRNPRAHVISQYYHCDMDAHLDPKVEIFDPQNWPAKPDIHAWLDHWASLQDKFNSDKATVMSKVKSSNGIKEGLNLRSESIKDSDTFHCYLPMNLQVRHMSCKERDYPFPSQDQTVIGDLDKYGGDYDRALSNLHELAYIGITELYQESLCVIHAKELGELPESCNCQNEVAWKTFHQMHMDHSVDHNHPGANQLDATNRDLIDKLNSEDWDLYVSAVRRFKVDLEEVEKKYDKKVLCDAGKLDALMSKDPSQHPMFFKYDTLVEDATSHFTHEFNLQAKLNEIKQAKLNEIKQLKGEKITLVQPEIKQVQPEIKQELPEIHIQPEIKQVLPEIKQRT